MRLSYMSNNAKKAVGYGLLALDVILSACSGPGNFGPPPAATYTATPAAIQQLDVNACKAQLHRNIQNQRGRGQTNSERLYNLVLWFQISSGGGLSRYSPSERDDMLYRDVMNFKDANPDLSYAQNGNTHTFSNPDPAGAVEKVDVTIGGLPIYWRATYNPNGKCE